MQADSGSLTQSRYQMNDQLSAQLAQMSSHSQSGQYRQPKAKAKKSSFF